LQGHEGQVGTLAFAPDGDILASACSADGKVRVWKVTSKQSIREFGLNQNQPLTSLSFSANGRLLAYGKQGELCIADLKKQDQPQVIEGHEGMVWAVAFAPTGYTLASAGDDGKLIVWNALMGTKSREWQLGGPAYALRFSPDGRYLAVGNANGTIYVLRLG
jgi:WD40 repeat protein